MCAPPFPNGAASAPRLHRIAWPHDVVVRRRARRWQKPERSHCGCVPGCAMSRPALLPTACTHDQYSLAILASLGQQHLTRILTGACLCAGATVSPTRPSRRRSMALLVNHRGERLEDGSSYNNNNKDLMAWTCLRVGGWPGPGRGWRVCRRGHGRLGVGFRAPSVL